MRTFLTYVLAALAATFAGLVTVPVLAPPLLLHAEPGYSEISARILPYAIASSFAVFVLGSVGWLASGLVLRDRLRLGPWNLLRGIVAVLTPMMVLLALVGWYSAQIGGDFVAIVSATFQKILLLAVSPGLAWGGVFWLRTPRPQNMEAAA